MGNFKIKIDVQQLRGAAVVDLKGKDKVKKCLVIPIEDSDMYQGKRGLYLNLIAWKTASEYYGETHMVKVDIPKDKYDAMSDAQKRSQPVIGGMRPIGGNSATDFHKPSANIPEPPAAEFPDGNGENEVPF